MVHAFAERSQRWGQIGGRHCGCRPCQAEPMPGQIVRAFLPQKKARGHRASRFTRRFYLLPLRPVSCLGECRGRNRLLSRSRLWVAQYLASFAGHRLSGLLITLVHDAYLDYRGWGCPTAVSWLTRHPLDRYGWLVTAPETIQGVYSVAF